MSPLKDAESSTSFVEAGPCVVELVTIEDGDPGQYGDTMKWIFNLSYDGDVLLDGDGSRHEFWQWSSTNFTPRAKAPKWLAALLGRKIIFDSSEKGWEPTENLVNEALGEFATALIVEEDGADGMTYHRIPEDGMTPLKKKSSKKKAAPPEAESDDEDDNSPF